MDADKITNFFKFHFEKMILVVVIAASGFLLYTGFQIEHFTDKPQNQPERLASDATEVRNAIDEDHNQNIIPEREPTFDIAAATVARDRPVPVDPYKVINPWDNTTTAESIARRSDPELPAAEQLIAKPVMRIIAIRSASEEYDVASLDPAEPVEKIEQPTQRQPRRRRGRGGMGEMDMYGGGYGEDEMMEMMSQEDMMDMMGIDSAAGGATGPNRNFNAKHDFGVRPTTTEDKRHPVPQLVSFIAGTAVLPHKVAYENYELAFSQSDSYDPRRDTPYYYNIEVQRADVTNKAVADLTDQDWVKVWDRLKYAKLGAYIWSGVADEIVPSDYRDDNVTMWIPPVLLDDYRDFCLHPAIPMKSKAQQAQELGLEEPVLDVPTEEDLFGDNSDKFGLGGPGQRNSRGMPGGEYDDYGDMGDDYGADMGMMGGFGGFAGAGIEVDPVDYKLLRFYDFFGLPNSPLPGHQYVYRIRYSVNDPNFPNDPTQQPKLASLDAETSTRVLTLMSKAKLEKKRSFERWSDWSPPTKPVSLPVNSDYFAGEVSPSKTNSLSVGGKQVVYQRDPPTATIVASQYNPQYATRVPMRFDVTEGSVLSHKQETADVVDPITLEVKKLPDAEIITSTTIIDLDGGRNLSLNKGLGDQELKEPSLMLLYDMSGNLVVTDSVNDQEYYRIYSYAEERGE